ncbi:MAG: peptidase S10 [Desulfobacterota bacterium]|nr:peptidase S10 [Thermodesulfobacteriota bacterium]
MRTLSVLYCIIILVSCAFFTMPIVLHASDNTTKTELHEQDKLIVSHHRIAAKGKRLNYTTTAGWLILKNDGGQPRAKIFFIAYEKKEEHKQQRSITFAFNGGPGSSSVWLHMGALGPRRVKLYPDGTAPPPPAVVSDNDHTWLSFTDLVFVDPVGTGYSRGVDDKKEREFFDFKQDIASVGDFIRLWLTRFERWQSPVYLAGESYGTTRAVGLIDYLHRQHGIVLSGIILISPVLDFTTISFSPSNELPYLLYLPTYAAAAWHHKQAHHDTSLAQVLSRVEQWAVTDYVTILARGRALEERERQTTALHISAFAGLTPDYVIKNNLRIMPGRFRKELLRKQGVVIGRMDARITMPDTDTAAETATADPSLERLVGIFAGAVNGYIRNELRFDDDLPYTYLNYEANKAWNWQSGIGMQQGYISLSQDLADAMHLHNHLRVFVAAGYYDLATPYFAARYTIDHLPLEESRRRAIELHCYPGGHMMYTDPLLLQQLTADVEEFYRRK